MAAVKMYEVLEGKKYSGVHDVYTGGQKFPEKELRGDIKRSLNGYEDVIRKDKDGKSYTAIKGKKPTIKLVTGTKKADSK